MFGCPAYVLKKKLADGNLIPRWTPRSDQGRYVGRSPNHAGSVPLILNLATGNIMLQWNVVLDDWFATVPTSIDELPDFNLDKWTKMFGTTCYDVTTEEEIEEFNNTGPSFVQPKVEMNKRNEEFEIPQELL